MRNEDEPYSSCGFPIGPTKEEWKTVDQESISSQATSSEMHFAVPPTSPPTWFKAEFKHEPKGLRVPLRLHVGGLSTAFIWLNGVLLGRYYGKLIIA